jgi:hypothetical protein
MITKSHPIWFFPFIYDRWTGPEATRYENPDPDTTMWVWEEGLTQQQQDDFDVLIWRARTGLTEKALKSFKQEVNTLANYQSINSPNLNQTATAVKALITLLRAIFDA